MGRTFELTDDELVVHLSGWTAAAALRGELRVPLTAVRSVSTEPWRHDGIRLGGTAIPFRDYRQGRFRRNGRWLFLSFEDRSRTVTLEVDREQVGYDVVVVGSDDPQSLADLLAGAGRRE